MVHKFPRSICARSTWNNLIITLAISLACGANAIAEQTFSWLGVVGNPGSHKWSAGGNWDGGTAPPAPGASDVQLVFDGTPAGLISVNGFDKFTLNRILFGATAGSYVIQGAVGTELLDFVADDAVAPALLNDSNSTIMVPHAISFNSGLELGGSGTGSIALTGGIVGRGTLTKSGAGTVTLDSLAADIQLDRLAVTGGVFNITGGTQLLANTAPNPLTASTLTGDATINISGTGSKLVAQFNSEIEAHTNGTINITDGGRLETFSTIDRNWWGRPGSGRTVVVDGSGSTWEHVGASPSTHRLRFRGSEITISNGGAFSTPGPIALESGARFTVDGGTATVGGLDSFSNPSLLELSDGIGNVSALTIAGSPSVSILRVYSDVIADGPGGAGSITMMGGQQVFANLANSYSGGTKLLGGVLRVLGNGALGSGDVYLNGGTLIFDNSATLERMLTFGANGGKLGANSGKTLTIDQVLNLTAPLSIVDTGTVRLTGANQYNSLFLEGKLELTNDADATVAGALVGGGGTLIKRGDGALTLMQGIAPGENLNGATVVVQEGALRLTHAQAMYENALNLQKNDGLILDLGPSPAAVSLGGLMGSGNLHLGAHSLVLGEGNSSFQTNFTGTIEGTGSITVERGGQLLGVNAYTGGTILKGGQLTIVPGTTIGDVDAQGPYSTTLPTLHLQQNVDATYAGSILGGIKVFKQGAGMLTMTGSDYGAIRLDVLEGGVAVAAGPNGQFVDPSDVTTLYAGATFRALSGGGFGVLEFLESSTLDTNGHRVTAGYLRGGTASQAIATKVGAGVLSIESADATGLRVLGGTLEVIENSPIGPINIGAITIADTASLTGIAALDSSTIFLESGGKIAPGLESQAIATLQANSLEWDAGGILQLDLAVANSSDRVALAGHLGKGATSTDGFRFDLSVLGSVENGVYPLVSFGSTDFVVSDFDYFGLPAGAVGEFELQANALVLYLTIQPGDYNLNGVVDAADYTLWRDSFGQTGIALAADGNGNGNVDAGDYEIWKNHLGEFAGVDAGKAGSNVPEPAALMLAALGLLGLWARIR